MDPIEEAVARAICDAWGYCWDGDPDDEQTAPEVASNGDTRPDKALYREAAGKAIAAHLTALKAAGFKVMKEPGQFIVSSGMDADEVRRACLSPTGVGPYELRSILTGGR